MCKINLCLNKAVLNIHVIHRMKQEIAQNDKEL